MAQLRITAYQQRIARYFNKKVVHRGSKVGDLVLRKIINREHSALGPNWEGPYRVKIVLGPGTYRLETLDEPPIGIPRAWNAENLKKYFA